MVTEARAESSPLLGRDHSPVLQGAYGREQAGDGKVHHSVHFITHQSFAFY